MSEVGADEPRWQEAGVRDSAWGGGSGAPPSSCRRLLCSAIILLFSLAAHFISQLLPAGASEN